MTNGVLPVPPVEMFPIEITGLEILFTFKIFRSYNLFLTITITAYKNVKGSKSNLKKFVKGKLIYICEEISCLNFCNLSLLRNSL